VLASISQRFLDHTKLFLIVSYLIPDNKACEGEKFLLFEISQHAKIHLLTYVLSIVHFCYHSVPYKDIAL